MKWKDLSPGIKGGIIGAAAFVLLFAFHGLINLYGSQGQCLDYCPADEPLCSYTPKECFNSGTLRFIPEKIFEWLAFKASQELLNEYLLSFISEFIINLIFFAIMGGLLWFTISKLLEMERINYYRKLIFHT